MNGLACGDECFSGANAFHLNTCSLAPRLDDDRQRELHENLFCEICQTFVLTGKCSWDANAYGARDAVARKLVHT